jgi:hypothetical protein
MDLFNISNDPQVIWGFQQIASLFKPGYVPSSYPQALQN